MRAAVVATAICFSIVALGGPGDAKAFISKPTDIPAEGLGPALTTLAKEFNFQVLYRTEVVGKLRTDGVSGTVTATEALDRLLRNTGLTYKYLDDNTVTVFAVGGGAGGNTSMDGPGSTNVTSAERTSTAARTDSDDLALETIVVTATRREENINSIPVSVTAMDSVKLDEQGIVSVDDLVRMVPGVTFTRGGYADTSEISIRGISSRVGTATTGIYVDDTPVQVRTLGFAATNLYPENFDLQRIEVLRGPQGTLFGAGSEGGTVRFLTTAPSVTEYSGYARADSSDMQHGSASGEVGAAFGGPIVVDKLGFRVSAWYEHTGGYIDQVSPIDGSSVDNHANWDNNYAVRAALRFVPADAIDATLSTYTQYQRKNDASYYYEEISAPSTGVFKSADPLGSPSGDKYWLTSLSVKAKLGTMLDLVSVTSDLTRKDTPTQDYSHFFPTLLFGPTVWDHSLSLPLPNAPYNYESQSNFVSTQNNFVQELRIQTTPETGPISGTAGVFYTLARQSDTQQVYDPTLTQFTEAYTGLTVAQAFGSPMLSPTDSYLSKDNGRDKQTAIFGDVGYEVVKGFKIDAGVRYQWSSFDYSGYQAGPWAGPSTIAVSGRETAHPTTPRFYVSYQVDDQNLVYASATKGFRIGGANKPIPTTGAGCTAQLGSLGYTNAPASYNPDTLWNYEIGSKNGGLNGRLQVNSSLFYIRWSDIQQSVYLPACGFNFVTNLGSAVSKGGDIQADFLVTKALSLSLSVAYTDAYYSSTVAAGSGATFVTEGDALQTAPWSIAGVANYKWMLAGLPSYLRLTYAYESHLSRATPDQNPADVSANPVNVNPDALHFATVRLGAEFRPGLEGSVYCDNLFDSAPLLAQYNDIVGSRIIYGSTLTPRTIGARLTYRF